MTWRVFFLYVFKELPTEAGSIVWLAGLHNRANHHTLICGREPSLHVPVDFCYVRAFNLDDLDV